MKTTLKGTFTLNATNQSRERPIRPATVATGSLTKSTVIFTSSRRLLEPRGFAPDAEVTGVLGDAMMTGKAVDVALTILVGGIIWLLVTVAGLG